MSLKSIVQKTLPTPIRERLRPIYRRLFQKSFVPDLAIGEFAGFQIAYRTHSHDKLLIDVCLVGENFLSQLPEYRLEADHTIIDVGAHIGAFAVATASRLTSGRLFAVEACLETFNLLRINVALNGLKNVVPVHVALSDRDGECTLYYDTDGWGHSVVANFAGRGETVPALALSSFLDANGISSCHLMKLNCEGAEFPILLGAAPEVLRRFGVILTMYHADLYPNSSLEALVAHFRDSGFQVDVRNRETGVNRGWLVATNPSFAPQPPR